MLHHHTDMNLSVHQVAGHNLTAIHTHKFKTMTIAWYLERPLDTLAPVYALAVRLMVRAFGGDDPMGVNRRLQGLYGAYLQAEAVKYGDLQSLQLKLTFVSDLHLPHPIAKDALGCFVDMFTMPVTDFAGFEQLVHLEKGNLLSTIAQREQDRSAKAYDSLLEGLFPNSSYGKPAYGSRSEVHNLTVEQVLTAIQDLVSLKPFTLKIIGDMEPGHIVEILEGILPCTTVSQDQATERLFANLPLTGDMVKAHWTEHQPVEQAKLALAYTVKPPQNLSEYYSAILLGHLLGGGPSALLFKEVRENRGLCYAIHARVDKFLGILTVHAGLKLSKVDEVKDVVNQMIFDVIGEEIDESSLALSKKMLIGSYNALADTPVGCLNFVHSQRVARLPESLDKVIELVEQIPATEIVKVAQTLRLIGGFTLAPKEKGHD